MQFLAFLINLASPLAASEAVPWQMGFQEPATSLMERVIALNNFILILITAICILVLVLLVWCVFRYHESRNPTPSTTSHNTLLEIIWTLIPVSIIISVAIPATHLLYYQERIPQTELTIKATGYQWYWGYEYPDHEGLSFDALMLAEEELPPNKPRLLSTDNVVVVPVDTNIRLLVTAGDVLHSWAMPAFGVKIDGVPGRINQVWFRANKEGTFYGQCSELCGRGHAFMPIELKVVSREAFKRWVAAKKKELAFAE